MQKSKFLAVDSQKSFNVQEQEVLKFWKDYEVFKQSVETRNPKNEYTFYDGPPFATGLPHYGHFLASVIKDMVPRYFTMKGFRVERRFGWDCHGLPIENIVEKELGTKSKKDIEEKIGIEKFNEDCRSKVLLYVNEWEKIITRLGRWVDFENDYKTMDIDFMESVIWLFAELYKKNLIYEGRRISLYCPRCATPLSNFEIAMDNSYQMRHDQTATAKFKLIDENTNIPTYILAWTTTPWTLPSNFALAVNPELEYIKVNYKGSYCIVVKSLASKIFGEDFETVEMLKGSDLVGKNYEPLFPYFDNRKDLFKVVGADFVSDEEGTGIVHLAPYGEDDFNLAREKGLDILDLETVDDGGNFKKIVSDFAGMAIMDKDTNKKINQWLEEQDKLFEAKQYSHNYPHCWRCETPLFYNPQRAYFLNVQSIKDRMLTQNENINWKPTHLKHGRFQKGLETAPDWNLSRNRFWGTPIPIWKCEDCEHHQVVDSIKELEKLSGEKVTDLHKHFVDKYTWKCEKCGGIMTRTTEVLDCWFESGAMPYAQKHYPFENEDRFAETFPGDFIAEYISQTRGWFYTLHVLSTAFKDSHAFKNVICTGTILAEDGNKMSKSKKNYPDPSLIFEKYGSDAMRYYLMASSVMKGENFNFTEKGVEEILKTIILPIRNAYQFFQLYANIDGWSPTKFSFVRHGEAHHNILGVYSGKAENEHCLTEEGKKQAQKVSQVVGSFDFLVCSPFIRTREMAKIILETAKSKITPIEDERLREIDFGDLEGEKYIPIIERLKRSSGESLLDIQARMEKALEDYASDYRGKHTVIVSHGGPIRYVVAQQNNVHTEEGALMVPSFKTGGSYSFFALPQTENELDLWILSETQVLLKHYRTKMDEYEIAEALKEIPPFVDNLNNWYLRRSRKRFWEEGLGEDKISGYETLHYVLLTLSKILAPVCPFFAEKLFQDLSQNKKNSVHLEFLPIQKDSWIDEKLNEKIKISREIVRLSASIRAKKKIKLRQPLAKLQFSISNAKDLLQPSDILIIEGEANVKKIEILTTEALKKIAKKIVKVDARKVGRKFGKKMQELIVDGKAGNFKELDDGQIEIAGEILEADEYEAQFDCEGEFDAENCGQLVVLLETEISEELKIEGFAREIIRAIQEQRKINGFEISDRINVSFVTESEILKTAFEQFQDKISQEVLAVSIKHEKILTVEEIEIDGEKINLKLIKN